MSEIKRVEADVVEQYPAVAVYFEDEKSFGSNPGWRRLELSEEEIGDLRRARDAWLAWERRLLAILDPES
jgi:hypothetical protein